MKARHNNEETEFKGEESGCLCKGKAKRARNFWGGSRFHIFKYPILHSFLSHLFNVLRVPDTGIYRDTTFHVSFEMCYTGDLSKIYSLLSWKALSRNKCMNQKRILCQTRYLEFRFGKHGHLNNGTLFEEEKEQRKRWGKGSLDLSNQGGCAFTKEDMNLLLTSGHAVTKGNSASAYTGVNTSFFHKPGVSTGAEQVQKTSQSSLSKLPSRERPLPDNLRSLLPLPPVY